MHVRIYTDGACSGNPGPGGYAAILSCGDHRREIVGGEAQTTNNRMELMAVIKALDALKQECEVDVYSDSAYVVNAFNQGWIQQWRQRGWRTSGKKSVQNTDLWKQLLSLVSKHTVTFHKVAGHADDPFNNRCDELARGEALARA